MNLAEKRLDAFEYLFQGIQDDYFKGYAFWRYVKSKGIEMFHIYDPDPKEMVRKISKIKNDFMQFASKLVTEYHTLFNSKYKETLEYVNKLEKATGIKLSQQMKIALNIIRMEIGDLPIVTKAEIDELKEHVKNLIQYLKTLPSNKRYIDERTKISDELLLSFIIIGKKLGYDPLLLLIIGARESSLNNKANSGYAIGISQQTFFGAFSYYFNPKNNIKIPILLPTMYSDIKKDFPDIYSIYAMALTLENKKLEKKTNDIWEIVSYYKGSNTPTSQEYANEIKTIYEKTIKRNKKIS